MVCFANNCGFATCNFAYKHYLWGNRTACILGGRSAAIYLDSSKISNAIWIITYSPVFAMMSGPCKLLANFSWDLWLKVSISQIAYLAFFVGLGLLMYNKGTKKVNVNGG